MNFLNISGPLYELYFFLYLIFSKKAIKLPSQVLNIELFIIFPSFVHHQVQPVTRGTRVSLVSWYHGQPYV